MSIAKFNNWTPATHADPKPDPDPLARPIDFVLTKNDRTAAAIVRCDIEAMQRRFRQPEGLEVTEISMEEFYEARDAFRKSL
jgi:hypothetical protein